MFTRVNTKMTSVKIKTENIKFSFRSPRISYRLSVSRHCSAVSAYYLSAPGQDALSLWLHFIEHKWLYQGQVTWTHQITWRLTGSPVNSCLFGSQYTTIRGYSTCENRFEQSMVLLSSRKQEKLGLTNGIGQKENRFSQIVGRYELFLSSTRTEPLKHFSVRIVHFTRLILMWVHSFLHNSHR